MPNPDDTQKKAAKPSKVEGIKDASHGLAGPVSEELGKDQPAFSEESVQVLKHHGTYQQDNRDTRTERKKAGLDREWSFMIRTKFPAGEITAEQYLLCDELSTKYGQDDLRVTSRQCFQFHGVVKSNLRPLLHDLNTLQRISTLGACGDVVRNTMACPVADIDPAFEHCGADLMGLARRVSDHFMPRTTAYFDLWVNDEKATVNDDGTVTYASEVASQTEEPIYGKVYLPRKFKIGITTDFDNATDVFTQDVGVIGVTENGRITGWDVTVGGGLGFTHRKPETYSRLGTHLAHVSEDEVIPLLEAIVKVQRDHGDRSNRRHARMKYLVDDLGIDAFREKVFEYAGRRFDPPREARPQAQPDYLGWHKQHQAGLNYVGVWVENGRIRDFENGFRFKAGLKEVIGRFRPSVRLTPHHNVILANIRDEDVDAVQALLDEYGLPTDKGISTVRRLEMACPALPLCSLAISEAERFMPSVMQALEDAGHAGDDIIIRMSGCPNNCSRPRSAELGLIGSGSGQYQLYTGGDYFGGRLNEMVLDKLKEEQVAPAVIAVLDAWKAEGNGERFGDWSARVGVDAIKARLEPALA